MCESGALINLQFHFIQCHTPARTGCTSHSSSSLASTANASASPTSTNASYRPSSAASSSELSPHKSMRGCWVPSGAANIKVGARGGALCDMGAKRAQTTRVYGAPLKMLMQVNCPDPTRVPVERACSPTLMWFQELAEICVSAALGDPEPVQFHSFMTSLALCALALFLSYETKFSSLPSCCESYQEQSGASSALSALS
jgi:hypothetical protein